MGVSFSINDALEFLIASPGQIVKSVCYVFGSTYLLYELGQLMFCFLEKENTGRAEGRGRLVRMYQNHPFWVSFFAVMLFWLPHLIIAYPGYICLDAWYQLEQFFGKLPYTLIHPPVPTILLGLFTQLGLRLGDANVGIYISIILQSVISALVLAYELSLMKKWSSPQWLRIISFGVIALVPYYTNYVVTEIKDTLYAIWFLLFVMEIICMLQKGFDYFSNRKHVLLLAVSIMGTVLFRNNGKYVLYPTILVLLVYLWAIGRKNKKKIYVKSALCFLMPVLAANLLSVALIGYYGIGSGSFGEALSLPFQQTARYLLEYGDDVTDEEAEAIRVVLDYDNLAEKYDPLVSDPVKGTYVGDDQVTKKELLQYFVVWVKMFFRHPDVYIKATMNQSYYLLYPFIENNMIFYETVPPYGDYVLADELIGELGVSGVEALQNYRNTLYALQLSFFSLPIIGMFSHPALYCILLIFLIVFAIYRKLWHLIVIMFPLVLSAVIVVLAPAIQLNARYAFPIIYAMPIIVAYYIYLEKPNSDK